MTLEEAIKHAEEIAEENQRIVDTHVVFDDVTIDMLYCDDTEVIEEHLANYQECAEKHRQLAEWLKDYKQLLGQELKTGRWEFVGDDCYRCTACGEVYTSNQFDAINNYYDNRFPKGCPNCGTRMESGEEDADSNRYTR